VAKPNASEAVVEALRVLLTSRTDRDRDGGELNFADTLLLCARVIGHGLGKVSLADNTAELAAATREVAAALNRIADVIRMPIMVAASDKGMKP
jgi:hypothetical protein